MLRIQTRGLTIIMYMREIKSDEIATLLQAKTQGIVLSSTEGVLSDGYHAFIRLLKKLGKIINDAVKRLFKWLNEKAEQAIGRILTMVTKKATEEFYTKYEKVYDGGKIILDKTTLEEEVLNYHTALLNRKDRSDDRPNLIEGTENGVYEKALYAADVHNRYVSVYTEYMKDEAEHLYNVSMGAINIVQGITPENLNRRVEHGLSDDIDNTLTFNDGIVPSIGIGLYTKVDAHSKGNTLTTDYEVDGMTTTLKSGIETIIFKGAKYNFTTLDITRRPANLPLLNDSYEPLDPRGMKALARAVTVLAYDIKNAKKNHSVDTLEKILKKFEKSVVELGDKIDDEGQAFLTAIMAYIGKRRTSMSKIAVWLSSNAEKNLAYLAALYAWHMTAFISSDTRDQLD